MFAMFRNFFAMFATMFAAMNKLANAANHAAGFVEGESEGFAERASLERLQQRKALLNKYSIEDQIAVAELAIASNDANIKIANLKAQQPAESAA